MAKVLIVRAPYYTEIIDELTAGTTESLKAAGLDYEIIDVAGALEIPAAMAHVSHAQTNFSGFIALGCVIRGETSHYDYICAECFRGLNQLAIEQGLAIGVGVLTCENQEQAKLRADRKQKNKGQEAVSALLSILELHKKYPVEGFAKAS